MSLNRRIEDLEPKTREAAIKAVAILKSLEIRYFISETRRSQEVQNAYFSQGRKPLTEVNCLRIAAGLWAISEAENYKKITQTLKSLHIEGKALDICPADKAGNPSWNAPQAEWVKIADVMKSVGFEWGGDWAGAWDKPHYQLRAPV